MQTLDVHVTRDERERRPAQRQALCREPHAVLVTQLQSAEIDGRREGARQAREPHMAVRDARNRALDERSPGVGVAGDQHRGHQRDEDRQHRAERPGTDPPEAPHQNACPMPM